MSSGRTERHTMIIFLGLGLLILAGLAAFAWSEATKQKESLDQVRSIFGVIEHLNHIYAYVQNAETSQHGFLITQDATYLEPYHAAVQKIPPALDDLLEIYTDNDREYETATELRDLIIEKMAEIRGTLGVAKKDLPRAHDIVRTDRSIELMRNIRTHITTLRTTQYEHLHDTDRRERHAASLFLKLFFAGNLTTLMLMGLASFLIFRDSRLKEQAEEIVAQIQLINLAPVMTRTLDGRILSWSEGYHQLFGWAVGEAVGRKAHELLRTQSTTPLDAIQSTLLTDGQWTGELTHMRRDGTELMVAATWTLVKGSQGRPAMVIEMSTDITNLKNARVAQAKIGARFHMLADNISQFAWIADSTGSIEWYNQRWFDYTGTTLEQMQGDGWKHLHHPDHIDRVMNKITHSFKTGETWEDTFPLRAQDGQYRWFLSRAIPIRSEDGRILQWFGTNTDVTELQFTQKQLNDYVRFTNAILDSLHEHIAVINRQGVIVQVNAAWTQFARENQRAPSLDALGTGVNYLDILRNAAKHDSVACVALEGVLATLRGERDHFECQYSSHVSGKPCWLHMSVTPLRVTDGGVVLTHTDITSQKLAQEFQRGLAAIVDGSTDAMISKSKEGEIRTWNRGAEELFGYVPEEIIGQSVNVLVPSELQDEEHLLRNMVLSGERITQFESWRLHKNGRPIPVLITMSPIRDSDGKIVGTSQVMSDITARQQTEVALMESEEKFRTLVTAIPQLVWTCTPDGHCDYLSGQWLTYTGKPIEEHLGAGWLDAIHPDDRARVSHDWRAARLSESSYSTEYRLRAADGSYQWFLGKADPHRDAAGRICKWFGTSTNITDQKESAAKLEHVNHMLESRGKELTLVNKELEAFSYSVSHDLRAPLRTMTGFSHALLEDYGHTLEPEAIRHLTIISKGAQKLGYLIDDLLAFSRLSRQQLRMNPIMLNELIEEVQVDLAAEQSNRMIEWHIETLPTCRGDRTTVKLVLANLIGNALKYSRLRNPARIDIDWRPDDQRQGIARINVRDNGVGFDMRYADKLFGVFQRLHKPNEFEGTGVGLAIVQRIVHRHGGRVGGEGRVNEGSTFWFTLELVT